MSEPILALNALPNQSQIRGYDKVLRTRATVKDIYTNHSGLFDRTERMIPNAIYMKIDGKSGSNTDTITLKTPVRGAPVLGNRRLVGTEVEPETKAATIYRNNYRFAVRTEEYGTRDLDQAPYGLYKKHIAELSTWAREYEGLEIRQAILERVGMTLLEGDTAGVVPQEWNPNIYVQGAADGDQPTFNTDLATYTNEIVASIIAAGGFAQTAPQAATFQLMNKLSMEALDRKLWPLKIDNNDAYIFVVSELQSTIFADPTWSANTGGAVWIQRNQLPDRVQKWNGIIGKFEGTIGADIYVVTDPRCPTLIPSGTGAPFGLRAGYYWMGDDDRRQRNNPNVRDACFLLGTAAIAKWDAEPLHHIKQDDDYFKIMGHGIAGVRGIQQVQFDQQNPDATSREYYGSMVVVMARPNYNS